MALGQLRCVMSEYSGIEFDHLQLNVLVNKGKNTKSSSYILSVLMLLVANLANTKLCEKNQKITESLAYGYSSECAQRELSNEYQHDRV